MRLNDIREKLLTSEYDFLRNDDGLGKNIMLLTTGGSYAYGTNTENSDIDIRGITLNSKEEILTMNCREIPYEDKATDTVIYTLNQIKALLTNCNPNTIEILGTDEEQLFVCTPEGRLLRDNIYTFLSKKAIQSFGGYATAQLRRLQNALARDNYPRAEKEMHILKSINKQMTSFEERYNAITKQNIKLYLDKSDKVDFDHEIYMDVKLIHYPLRDFKSIYSEMSNVIKDYESLNHRNNKKDELHLNKHAMHLIRLLIMGTEILEGKGVNTSRKSDREFLMKIRKGEFVTKINNRDDYSQIFNIVDEYEKKFIYASENTTLPDKPDYSKIDELIMELNWSVLHDNRY